MGTRLPHSRKAWSKCLFMYSFDRPFPLFEQKLTDVCKFVYCRVKSKNYNNFQNYIIITPNRGY